MANRKYELTEAEAELCFAQVGGHVAALKNWICTAIEDNDVTYAQKLLVQLRKSEALYAKLNVEAHKFIDGRSKD